MSTYLITGATGFLGRHLVSHLQATGHDVVALVRTHDAELQASGARLVEGDVLDAKSIEQAAQACDGLFHCAGLVSRDPEQALKMFEVHVNGTKITLDAAKGAGIKRVVYLSTSGTVAISEKEKPLPNEDSPVPYGLVGKWPYYRSKLYAEQEALARNNPDFEVICLNPSLLLGPGDLRGSATDDIRLFLEQKIPAVPKGGLSYVDVRDVAQAALVAMKKGKPGQRYLLGACNITFEEYLKRMERISGISTPWMQAPKNEFLANLGTSILKKVQSSLGTQGTLDEHSAEMARYFWYLDGSLAKRELDFRPRDSVETLRETIHDLLERGVAWPADPEASNNPLADAVKETTQATQDRLTDLFKKHATKIAQETLTKALQKK